MAKKRKTRQEKIILQLKRQLGQKEPNLAPLSTKIEASQEEVFIKPQIQVQEPKISKISDVSNFSGDLKLIKKDLFKTFVLTFIIISFELVLYLKLR
ncbi:MAG: hypothetical protein NTV20_00345 [Candidatus Shapirobacteria bacterium]|nr:hypothetical protein [Candidatus Shapirobacteria bacterium]